MRRRLLDVCQTLCGVLTVGVGCGLNSRHPPSSSGISPLLPSPPRTGAPTPKDDVRHLSPDDSDGTPFKRRLGRRSKRCLGRPFDSIFRRSSSLYFGCLFWGSFLTPLKWCATHFKRQPHGKFRRHLRYPPVRFRGTSFKDISAGIV